MKALARLFTMAISFVLLLALIVTIGISISPVILVVALFMFLL